MSKRKARDEDPPPRPVLYYPEDDTARPTQCVMPASPPIPHASSPARDRPPSRRPSKTPLNRKRRSALDNIGYVPEDIPTPRVFPKTSLFASAHASGSASKQPRTLSATFGKRRAASSDNEPTGAETEYVVDSSDQDGEVPARLKTKTKRKRMRKSYPTGLRIQPVPRPSLPIAKPTGFLPAASSRTPQQAAPQTSPARRGAVNRPALARTSPATNASPYRARVVPIQSERRKRPEPVVMLERRSKPKRPRISGPSPTPASAPPEVIVLSSSDSEQEQEPEREKEREQEQRQEEQGREREMEREVSNSPSLGGRWSRGSSRSSDVVVVDSPGDGEIEEIPAPPSRQQSISSPERVSAEGEHTRPEEVEDATEKDGSPMHVDPTPTITQTQPEESTSEPPQTSPEPPQPSLEPSQTSPEPPKISPEPTNTARPLSQTSSPPSYTLCPSGIPLFRPSTVASTLTSPRGFTPATLSARPTPTPAPREQSELGEFVVSPDQPRVEFGRPVLLFSKFDPPFALRDDSVLRDDEFESLSFKPSQDSEPAPEVAPVAPPAEEILLPSPTPVREPVPTDEPTESPVQPSPEPVPPAFEAATPSTLTPAPDELSPPPPKPRIRRMECVLLPRASKRTRAAMFPKAKGKGKSVEVLFEAGLLSRKVDKGKGVARGEKQGRWKVDSSSTGSGEGSEEYEDTEGSGQVEDESEEPEAEETESEVDESAPGPSTKGKAKTKKPRQVKYIVMDSRAASPSNYDDLPEIVAQTPERYCHCCRTLSTKGKLKMRCSNIVTRIRRGQGLGPGQCATAWCQRCIAKHDIVFNPLLMDFTCPLCSNSCECDVCRRKRGQDPLGIGAYKVVKQKPGRRTLRNVVGGSPPVEDEEDSSPPENVPGPSAPKPRGPTTWHGRHTPPPLRRGRATGSHVRSTSLHIFIPRRPQVDESREVEATEPQEAQETESQGQAQPEIESREPSEGDPDVDVEGTESNSAIDDSFWFEEPEEDEDGQSTDREDKMRTFEGDYGADATLLGADSVPFELHHDVPEEGPRHEDELPDFTFPLESTRPSVEPDARGYEGLLDGAEPEAEVQPEEPTETDDIEGEVQALSEAVLSLDQASPSFMQDNESVLEGLDANMTAAQIHFCGSESLELQPVSGAGPALDIGDPLGNDMDVLLDTIDLGQLHPEGTFETVPSITMADASSPASHESLRDIPLYDAATEAEPPEPAPPAPPLFIEHDFEVPLSGGPDFMRPRAHTTKSPSTTAPPPPSEGLLSPKTETDKGWSPEIEFSPIRDLAPFLRPQPEPDPTLDDPESAKSTILETPSPQLENYGDTITVAADLFEETNHSSREATVTTIDSRSDQKTSTEVASQASSESPVDSTSFALPSREQQVQVQDALRARFQAEAPPPDSQAESSESTKSAKEGKYLRSRRRYGMHE